MISLPNLVRRYGHHEMSSAICCVTEQKEDRIVDSYLMQLPQKARFGR